MLIFRCVFLLPKGFQKSLCLQMREAAWLGGTRAPSTAGGSLSKGALLQPFALYTVRLVV